MRGRDWIGLDWIGLDWIGKEWFYFNKGKLRWY
jgi:hypothetical protein